MNRVENLNERICKTIKKVIKPSYYITIFILLKR